MLERRIFMNDKINYKKLISGKTMPGIIFILIPFGLVAIIIGMYMPNFCNYNATIIDGLQREIAFTEMSGWAICVIPLLISFVFFILIVLNVKKENLEKHVNKLIIYAVFIFICIFSMHMICESVISSFVLPSDYQNLELNNGIGYWLFVGGGYAYSGLVLAWAIIVKMIFKGKIKLGKD